MAPLTTTSSSGFFSCSCAAERGFSCGGQKPVRADSQDSKEEDAPRWHLCRRSTQTRAATVAAAAGDPAILNIGRKPRTCFLQFQFQTSSNCHGRALDTVKRRYRFSSSDVQVSAITKLLRWFGELSDVYSNSHEPPSADVLNSSNKVSAVKNLKHMPNSDA